MGRNRPERGRRIERFKASPLGRSVRKQKTVRQEDRAGQPIRRSVRTLGCVVLLMLITLLAYGNTVGEPFVFDDEAGIVDNRMIRQVYPIGRFLDSSQPLTDFTFALNYAYGGLATPGYHSVNLAIHLLAGLILFGLIRRTMCLSRISEHWRVRADAVALIASAAWLVHPLQTESVTYLVQRSESLMGMLYLLALYAAARASNSSRRAAWFVLAVVACAAAMASKSVAVTAPVVIVLYDRTFLFDSWRTAIKSRWPLYAGLLGSYLVPLSLGVFHGLFFESSETATVGFGFKGISPMEYLQTQPGVILHYLKLLVWPVGQCLDYAWPIARTAGEMVIPSIVVGGLFLIAMVGAIRGRIWGLLGFAVLLILSPTSSFVPLKDPAFEHRMYVPLAPAIVLIVLCTFAILDRFLDARQREAAPGKRIGAVVAAVVIALLAAVTRARNSLYEDPARLWADVAAKAPHNPRAHNALGFISLQRGDTDASISAFREAIRMDSEYAPAFVNLGKAYFQKRDMEAAVREFRVAEHINPHAIKSDSSLLYATALRDTGRTDDAIEQFKLAISKNPKQDQAYYLLAELLWKQGRRDSAIGVYQQAISVNPDLAEARVNLGLVLGEQGRKDEAIATLEGAVRSIRADTNLGTIVRAHYNLAFFLVQEGRKSQAATHLKRVLALKPDHPYAAKLLAEVEGPGQGEGVLKE